MTALKLSGCSGRGEPVSAILQLLRDMSQLWQELGSRVGQWTGQRQLCVLHQLKALYMCGFGLDLWLFKTHGNQKQKIKL